MYHVQMMAHKKSTFHVALQATAQCLSNPQTDDTK
jgi:hypothetical protein